LFFVYKEVNRSVITLSQSHTVHPSSIRDRFADLVGFAYFRDRTEHTWQQLSFN